MSQIERIEKALHKAGPAGISPVDFQLPDVIDGGKPILRVAARIHELGDKVLAGHGDDGCARYWLRDYAPRRVQKEHRPPPPERRQLEVGLKSFGFCHGCLGALPNGTSCMRSKRVEVMTYWDPFGPELGCRHQAAMQEVRRAA